MRRFIMAATAVLMLAAPAVSMASKPDSGPGVKNGNPTYTTAVGTCATSGPSGSLSFSKGVAHYTVPDAESWASVRYTPTSPVKLGDINKLSFQSNSSTGGGMVYLKILTSHGDSIVYSPNLQPTGFSGDPRNVTEPGINSWYTHNVLTSGVRFNDDGDDHGNITWSSAVAQAGANQTVDRLSVVAGCSIGSGTVQADNITLNKTVVDFK